MEAQAEAPRHGVFKTAKQCHFPARDGTDKGNPSAVQQDFL